MNSRDFCYWLHGWFEINETFDHPNKVQLGPQLEMIKKHLNLVFENVTSENVGNETSNPINLEPSGTKIPTNPRSIKRNKRLIC